MSLIGQCSEGPQSDLDFLPPLDVHWVWHVHMLAPLSYSRDLQATSLGRIINHRPLQPLGSQATDMRRKTKEKWLELFPGEPFDIQTAAGQTEFTSSFTYDILQASSRQRVFYYQVVLTHQCESLYCILGVATSLPGQSVPQLRNTEIQQVPQTEAGQPRRVPGALL